MGKCDFVFDIGSSKIRLIALKYAKKRTTILYYKELSYSGFYDGRFLNEDDLQEAFEELLGGLKLTLNQSVQTCSVGLPNEFLYLQCKKITKKFLHPTKLTNLEVVDLFKVENKRNVDGYELISFSAMKYNVQGNDVASPEGMTVDKIQLEASYLYAKLEIVDKIRSCLQNLGVLDIEFLSTGLGEGLLLEVSPQPKIVVDVGNLSSSVAVIRGEGLNMLSGFSLGAGHITEAIMENCRLTYEEAELMKKKVVLTLSPDSDEQYMVQDRVYNFCCSVALVNKIVNEQIENIASILNELLTDFPKLEVTLMGDGLTKFKDIDKVLSKLLARKVKIYKSVSGLDSVYPISVCGLIELIKRTV